MMGCSTSALCISHRVAIEAAVAGTVDLDAGGTASAPRRVIMILGSASVRLVGLNVTNGYISGSNARGGGIFVSVGGHLNMQHCTCSSNAVSATSSGYGGSGNGGGIFIAGGVVTMMHCVLSLNIVNVMSGSSITLNGGGICVAGGSLSLTACEVIENAVTAPGGSWTWGGGVAVESGTVRLLHCKLSDNHAETWSQGGGISVQGGDVQLTQCELRQNSVTNSGGNSGGGLQWTGGQLKLELVLFASNIGQGHGQALYISRGEALAHESYLSNVTFQDHAPAKSTILALSDAPWRCPLGKYMPPTGSFTAEFTGCLYFCAPGYYGATDIATSFECTDRCPAGHFCEEGTAVPMPCEVGTFNPVIMGPSTQSCISCSPGTYNNEMGRAEACIPCPPGSLSGSPGAVACGPCPSGGFCAAQGAASLQQTFTPCKAGTFNPLNGSSSNASCLACPPGTVNPIPGSTSLKVCRECLPGSVAPVNGTANCILCPGGFFQKAKGATSCKPCEKGSVCPIGAVAPVPCEAGSYSDAINLTSTSQCKTCPPGASCSLGSTFAQPCPPGRHAPNSSSAKCTYCPAGAHQDQEGQTKCKACPKGGPTAPRAVP
eukprot:1981722-Prymnesium_polylepis.1